MATLISVVVMFCLYFALLSQYHMPKMNDIVYCSGIYAVVHPVITLLVYEDFEQFAYTFHWYGDVFAFMPLHWIIY